MIHFKFTMRAFNRHAALLAAGLLTAPGLLHAQVPGEQPPEPAPPDVTAPQSEAEPGMDAQGEPVAESKIDQFADAYVAVQAIQAQAAQELSTTKEGEKAIEVKANAEKEMVRAVERSGLQIEEFNHIANQMTTDLNLRSKVIDKVQKRSKG